MIQSSMTYSLHSPILFGTPNYWGSLFKWFGGHLEGIMDNLVTLKFFRVLPANGHTPVFADALATIGVLDLPDREQNLNPGVGNDTIVRLEQYEAGQDGMISGEFIRKQVSGIPPEATDDGLAPIELSDGGGLGYSSVFCFHEPTSTILLQAHPLAVTASKLRLYLTLAQNAGYIYNVDSVVKESAWIRYADGVPRKFVVKIATPQNSHGLDGSAETVREGLAIIGEAMDAPYIKIEVSMGTKRGQLNPGVVQSAIQGLLGGNSDQEIDLRQLKASVKKEGEEVDLIDFLEEHLKDRTVLDLSDRNVDQNFAVRLAHARNIMAINLPYLAERYGIQV